jgi:hypothetical protein
MALDEWTVQVAYEFIWLIWRVPLNVVVQL